MRLLNCLLTPFIVKYCRLQNALACNLISQDTLLVLFVYYKDLGSRGFFQFTGLRIERLKTCEQGK